MPQRLIQHDGQVCHPVSRPLAVTRTNTRRCRAVPRRVERAFLSNEVKIGKQMVRGVVDSVVYLALERSASRLMHKCEMKNT